MAEDPLNPSGYTPVQAIKADGTLNPSDVNGYSVIMAEHDHGENGGRARLVLNVPYETVNAAGNYPFQDTEQIYTFHETVRCLMAEKGIELEWNEGHMFSRFGMQYEEDGQMAESIYYAGDELGNVGASVREGEVDMGDENWSPVYRTNFFVLDNAVTQGLEGEQLAEIIRQSYYEAIQGIESADVPEIPYRGNGNDAELDDLPQMEIDQQCKPVIPMV